MMLMTIKLSSYKISKVIKLTIICNTLDSV